MSETDTQIGWEYPDVSVLKKRDGESLGDRAIRLEHEVTQASVSENAWREHKDALQWDLAATYTEWDKTASRTAIANHVGKSQPHITYMIAAHNLGYDHGPWDSFNDAYQAAKAPKRPRTDPRAGAETAPEPPVEQPPVELDPVAEPPRRSAMGRTIGEQYEEAGFTRPAGPSKLTAEDIAESPCSQPDHSADECCQAIEMVWDVFGHPFASMELRKDVLDKMKLITGSMEKLYNRMVEDGFS